MTAEYDRYIPDCGALDYADAPAVTGCGRLLLALLQRAADYGCGLVAPQVSTLPLLRQARTWLDRTERSIGAIAPAALADLTEIYDLLHRLVRRAPAPGSVMADCAMRAFRARVGSTSPVSESQLMRLLSERLRMRDAAFFDKPLLWFSLTLSDWHKATSATGRFPAATPRAEAIARAATLLREDLTACCGSRQGAYKQLLADAALAQFVDPCGSAFDPCGPVVTLSGLDMEKGCSNIDHGHGRDSYADGGGFTDGGADADGFTDADGCGDSCGSYSDADGCGDCYGVVSGEADPASLTAMLRLLGAARSAYIPADTADALELRIHSRLAASPLLTPPDRLSHHLAPTLLPALSAAS